jgi:cardiolipin synthase
LARPVALLPVAAPAATAPAASPACARRTPARGAAEQRESRVAAECRAALGRRLARVAGRDDGTGLVGGNQLRWLSSGKEFFDAAVAAIDLAVHHVHCVVYIFRPDETGRRFLDALTNACKRGVVVRLLFDSIGSFGLSASHLAPLRAAGGRAEAFLPLLWKRRPFTMNLRNHRKLLVVDGRLGFVGGRNVGDEYFKDRVGRSRIWLDAMLELRGPSSTGCRTYSSKTGAPRRTR